MRSFVTDYSIKHSLTPFLPGSFLNLVTQEQPVCCAKEVETDPEAGKTMTEPIPSACFPKLGQEFMAKATTFLGNHIYSAG